MGVLVGEEIMMGFLTDIFGGIFGGGSTSAPTYDNVAAMRQAEMAAEMESRLAQQNMEHQMMLYEQRAEMSSRQAENEKYLATLEEKTQQDLEALLSGIAEGVDEEEQGKITSIDFTNFFDALNNADAGGYGGPDPQSAGATPTVRPV